MLSNFFSSRSTEQLLQQPGTLAVLPFGNPCAYQKSGVIDAGLVAMGTNNINEVWAVEAQPIVSGRSERIDWRRAEDIICISYYLTAKECEVIEASAAQAYTSMMQFLMDSDYCKPFRFWNYLPDINVGEGDSEMYKRFCSGRLKAFQAAGLAAEDFPAASALGHYSQGAVVYAFASRHQPQHFKNTRQVNAYEYPREYGLSSPSFARASAITLYGKPCLFISGTASIIGHVTVAENDLQAQLETTAANIEFLLETANPQRLQLSTLKIYLRHAADYRELSEWLAKRYPGVPAVVTHADICRANLLVEIECFCL